MDKLIDEFFERLSFRPKGRAELFERSAHSIKNNQLIVRKFINKKRSTELKKSLKILLREARWCADQWTDVNMKYDDRRSFCSFLRLLQMSGLDWHKYRLNEALDNDISISNQSSRWLSLEAPPDDKVPSSTYFIWDTATKYYNRSLSLMQCLRRIRSSSGDDFSREQAGLLGSFLDHLIMMQHEQRVAAYSFSEHLEQLRKKSSDAASLLASTSNAVDHGGDRDKCPFNLSKHTVDSYMWKQKHLFDSLYIILSESSWLLMKEKNSRFTSPSFIKESDKILEMIVVFISDFKKSKESLDQYLLDNACPFIEDKMMQLVQENKEILDKFGNHIKALQEEGVGKGSVIEMLLGCLGDVGKITMDYHDEKNSSSSLATYTKAVEETVKLAKELGKRLRTLVSSTLSVRSHLGTINLWRILFESSLVDLWLDLIIEKHCEAIKLVKLLGGEKNKNSRVPSDVHAHLNWLNEVINSLLDDGDNVLLDFLSMHVTVAEITYMLGDAFTTGGAGMKDFLAHALEWNREGDLYAVTSWKDDDIEMESDIDFPWDKHNVPDSIKLDLDNPNMELVRNVEDYGADSEDEFT
ncbi:hypothetical protein MKW92_049206 [Papaver armeniacum]|nr:hypothetical protein MKW92_049206 [Papaver armeniacum]